MVHRRPRGLTPTQTGHCHTRTHGDNVGMDTSLTGRLRGFVEGAVGGPARACGRARRGRPARRGTPHDRQGKLSTIRGGGGQLKCRHAVSARWPELGLAKKGSRVRRGEGAPGLGPNAMQVGALIGALLLLEHSSYTPIPRMHTIHV